jgi:hypothetical protein
MNLLSKIIIPLIIFGNIILFKKNILDYDKIFIPLLNVFYYFLLFKILKYILNRLERALFNFINSNDTMNFDYKMIMVSLIIPILLVPLSILLLHFIIVIYEFFQNIIYLIYDTIINYIYRKFKYEITDTISEKIILQLNTNTTILPFYYSKNIFIKDEYLSLTHKISILDKCLYLKFTDKSLLDKLLDNLYINNIYNIKYNALYEIEQITNLTVFYHNTLNKFFVSDITNIILNFLFKMKNINIK